MTIDGPARVDGVLQDDRETARIGVVPRDTDTAAGRREHGASEWAGDVEAAVTTVDAHVTLGAEPVAEAGEDAWRAHRRRAQQVNGAHRRQDCEQDECRGGQDDGKEPRRPPAAARAHRPYERGDEHARDDRRPDGGDDGE